MRSLVGSEMCIRDSLYTPAELGYGERGQGQQIPGNSTLIFKVEVLKVKNEAKAEKK